MGDIIVASGDCHLKNTGNIIDIKDLLTRLEIIESKIEAIKERVFHIEKTIKTESPINPYKKYKSPNKNTSIDIIDYDFFNINKDKLLVMIEDKYKELEESRKYIKILNWLKVYRYKLLGNIGLVEYSKFLVKYIGIIRNIFVNKGYTHTKIDKKILKDNLTSIEKRIIEFPGFYEEELDIKDLGNLRIALNFYNDISPPTVFCYKDFIINISTCEIMFFPIKEIIKRYLLINTNYIYVCNKKNNPKDPYSFYYLDRIENDIKYWILDCRCNDLAELLSNEFLDYGIKLFRRFYYSIFHDNNYRKNYEVHVLNFEYDLKQILQNILLISSVKKCIDFLRSIIMENTTYKPNVNDKFNIKSDDNFIKRQYDKITDKDTKKQDINIIIELFDNINSADIDNIISSNLI